MENVTLYTMLSPLCQKSWETSIPSTKVTMEAVMMKELSIGFHLIQMKSGGFAFGPAIIKISIDKFESQQ